MLGTMGSSMINVIDNSSYIQKKQCFQETIIRSSNLKGEDEEH
jgi:hypothetical protein